MRPELCNYIESSESLVFPFRGCIFSATGWNEVCY